MFLWIAVRRAAGLISNTSSLTSSESFSPGVAGFGNVRTICPLVFVGDPAEVPADATPFDMRGIELSHHDDDQVPVHAEALFDGTHEYLRRRLLLGREPA